MSINLTDELLAKTKKGKISSAKQVFLEGDKENLQQIGDKTHQLEDAIKDITVSGGASTATAVSYSNSTSGMTAVTAQGAIDELAAKNKTQDTTIAAKAEKSDVQASISELKAKETAQDSEIAKKANNSDVTSKFTEESNRVNGELAKKANSADVTSQIQTEQTRVNAELEKKLQKDNNSDSSISDGSEEFVVTDSTNKVALKVDNEGTKVKILNICDENGKIIKTITKELLDKIEKNESDVSALQDTTSSLDSTKLPKDTDSDSSVSDGSEEFVVTDSTNKVALKVDKEGTKVKILNICDENGKVVKTITKELLDKIEKNYSEKNSKFGNTCLLQERKGTYYEILKYSVSGNLKASVDTNIAKFNRSIRVECDGVESTDDTTAVSRGIFTMDFTENPIKVDETLSFWYFIPTKYWNPSQITGSAEKKSIDVIRICVYTGDEKIFEDNYTFSQYAYNVGWNLYKFLNDSFVGKSITKITFNFVSFNNNPNFQVWIGQFVSDQRITPILNFNMDNDMRGISYTCGFANWLLENEFPVDLRINHLQETSNEDPGYTIVRKLYKKGLANSMPYSGSARNLNLKEAIEYLLNDKENGRLTSLYSSNSERDVVAVGNSTNHIDDTLLVAERLAGYKIMRSTNAYCYTSYMDKESCIMQTYGIGAIPKEEPENVDSLITKRIEDAKNIIDKAIKYGLAINFFTHQVCSKSQKGESDYNHLGSYYEAVTEILSYAKEKEKQGKIRIMSMYNISKELQL